MDEKRQEAMERLQTASPLEITGILQELEMYDATSSQAVIDEVYQQFESGDNMEDEILKPVFMSVIDGLLEAIPGNQTARKKGLVASRVLKECEEFSYEGESDNRTHVDGYTEYKNAREVDSFNSNMTQEYTGNRKLYEDPKAMKQYKKDNLVGEKTLVDEYTGKKNLYYEKDNPHKNYNDPTNRQQAQPDHIVPLIQVHNKFKSNYALDDSDIKRIANQESNFAVTSGKTNQAKGGRTNSEYIKTMEEKGYSVDKQTKQNMLKMQKNAENAIDKKANETVAKNLMGRGEADPKMVKAAVEKFKQDNSGKSPTKEEYQEIKQQLEKDKTKEIHGTAVKNAASQAKDYAVGNLILFIVKPIYYEFSDAFKHGWEDGVGANNGKEAIAIRFGRVKQHVLSHAKDFLGDNMREFVKGFVSSLIEGIISLFVGVFKQILKVIKEGIKIFVESSKILFGKNAEMMTPEQKGDAIIKLLGGGVIAVAGVGIEALLNKIGIGEPWSIVLSTMLSGIAATVFMYLLDKADLFSIKAEKRHARIIEIFEERIKDINEAAESFNIVAIEALRRQRENFEFISDEIQEGISSNDIEVINNGLYKMADFMEVELGYSNTEEFCDYMDSVDAIYL